jgi:predicted secreted protein
MNTSAVYAWTWWAVMLVLFVVAPVVGSRYRGDHRETPERRAR